MLHYNPRHVSSVLCSSGIATLCERPYGMPVESALNRHTIWPFTQVTIPDAVTIQYDLLKMSIVLLETCRG